MNDFDLQALLAWLTDLDAVELADQIEDVNKAMLRKIVHEKSDVAVYFYSDSCRQCDRIVQELESIDDEAHAADIDLVKINDPQLAKQYGIHAFPALVYFRERDPIIYAGKSLVLHCRRAFPVCIINIEQTNMIFP